MFFWPPRHKLGREIWSYKDQSARLTSRGQVKSLLEKISTEESKQLVFPDSLKQHEIVFGRYRTRCQSFIWPWSLGEFYQYTECQMYQKKDSEFIPFAFCNAMLKHSIPGMDLKDGLCSFSTKDQQGMMHLSFPCSDVVEGIISGEPLFWHIEPEISFQNERSGKCIYGQNGSQVSFSMKFPSTYEANRFAANRVTLYSQDIIVGRVKRGATMTPLLSKGIITDEIPLFQSERAVELRNQNGWTALGLGLLLNITCCVFFYNPKGYS